MGVLRTEDDLIFVHLTKYFPKDGTIITTNVARPDETLRFTVHFTINHPVADFMVVKGADKGWENMVYAVLIPFKLLMKQSKRDFCNLNPVDTFLKGSVNIPKGSIFVNVGSEDVNLISSLTDRGIEYVKETGNIKDAVRRVLNVKGYPVFQGASEADQVDNVLYDYVLKVGKSYGLNCCPHFNHPFYFLEDNSSFLTLKFFFEDKMEDIRLASNLVDEVGINGILARLDFYKKNKVREWNGLSLMACEVFGHFERLQNPLYSDIEQNMFVMRDEAFRMASDVVSRKVKIYTPVSIRDALFTLDWAAKNDFSEFRREILFYINAIQDKYRNFISEKTVNELRLFIKT
jgi:hypothetical protein